MRRRIAKIGLGLVILVLGVMVMGDRCVARRSEGFVYHDASRVPVRTWAIVLGAMVHPDGSLSDALADRLEGALALYRSGRVHRILVSGDGIHGEDGAMSQWLLDQGVPGEAIVRDATGYRTHTTMSNARGLGIRDAIVCTQEFHIARSVMWARHEGIDAVGFVVEDKHWQTSHVKARLRETVARTVAMFELWGDR